MAAENKIDYKTAGIGGIGGAGLVALLMNFQSQGIDLISKNSLSHTQIAVEKTLANAQRIDRLEDNVRALNIKIDNGFESVRMQISKNLDKLTETVNAAASDSWTKSQHATFERLLDRRIDRIERRLEQLEDLKK